MGKQRRPVQSRSAYTLRDMNPQPTVEVYDRIIDKFPHGFLAKKLLKLGIKEGKALDVACGPGHLLCDLAQLAPKLKLYGLDISSNMLEAAHKKFKKKGLDRRIRLYLGSAYDLPFEDNYFDLVTNTLALHCLEEPQKFFTEFVRVMKPGGKGLILAYKRDTPKWIRIMAYLHSRYLAWKKVPLDGMGPVIDASYTIEEIEDYLRQYPLTKWQIKESMIFLITILLEK